jgi:hypothetical protein
MQWKAPGTDVPVRNFLISFFNPRGLCDSRVLTKKQFPFQNDIDLVVVLSSDHDFSAEFQPSEYNVLSKRQVHPRFGFDLLVARSESEEYRRYLEFFQQVRLEPGRKKGILRIWLR